MLSLGRSRPSTSSASSATAPALSRPQVCFKAGRSLAASQHACCAQLHVHLRLRRDMQLHACHGAKCVQGTPSRWASGRTAPTAARTPWPALCRVSNIMRVRSLHSVTNVFVLPTLALMMPDQCLSVLKALCACRARGGGGAARQAEDAHYLQCATLPHSRRCADEHHCVCRKLAYAYRLRAH